MARRTTPRAICGTVLLLPVLGSARCGVVVVVVDGGAVVVLELDVVVDGAVVVVVGFVVVVLAVVVVVGFVVVVACVVVVVGRVVVVTLVVVVTQQIVVVGMQQTVVVGMQQTVVVGMQQVVVGNQPKPWASTPASVGGTWRRCTPPDADASSDVPSAPKISNPAPRTTKNSPARPRRRGLRSNRALTLRINDM